MRNDEIDIDLLHDALVDAFDLSSLRVMIQTKLSVRMDDITHPSNLSNTVLDLIEYYRQRDQMSLLLCTSYSERPNHRKLRRIAKSHCSSTEDSTSSTDLNSSIIKPLVGIVTILALFFGMIYWASQSESTYIHAFYEDDSDMVFIRGELIDELKVGDSLVAYATTGVGNYIPVAKMQVVNHGQDSVSAQIILSDPDEPVQPNQRVDTNIEALIESDLEPRKREAIGYYANDGKIRVKSGVDLYKGMLVKALEASTEGAKIVDYLPFSEPIEFEIVEIGVGKVEAMVNLRLGDLSLLEYGTLVFRPANIPDSVEPDDIDVASDDEILIVVTKFFTNQDQDILSSIDFQQRIGGHLANIKAKYDLTEVRIEFVDRMYASNQDEEARKQGEMLNATMVMWGSYDAVSVSPKIAFLKEADLDATPDEYDIKISNLAEASNTITFANNSLTTIEYWSAFVLGQMYYLIDEYEEAGALFNDALESSQQIEDKSEIHRTLAILHGYNGTTKNFLADVNNPLTNPTDLAGAKQEYSRSIEIITNELTGDDGYNETSINSLLGQAYNNRGFVCSLQGDYESAIADYQKAIEIIPRFAMASNNLGKAYHDLGELQEALEYYSNAIEYDPEYGIAYANRGNIYGDLGNAQAAFSDYENALAIDGKDHVTYYNRAKLHVRQGDLTKALVDLNRAIDLESNFAFAYTERGIVHSMLNDNEAALIDLDKAVQLKPDDPWAFYNRGLIYKNIREIPESIDDYTTAINLATENELIAEAHNGRGISYSYQGDMNKSLEDHAKAIELNPKAAYYNDRGFTYFEIATDYFFFDDIENGLASLDDALPDYDEAVRLDPSFPNVYTNRAVIYELKEKTDLAIQDFETYLRVAPDADNWEAVKAHVTELKATRDAETSNGE